MDARTPKQYFQSTSNRYEAFERIRGRLDLLLEQIQQLKQQKANTKAHQEIIVNDLVKLEQQKCRAIGKRLAREAVEQIAVGNPEDAVKALKDCLDAKAVFRTEPFMFDKGKEIEKGLFGDNK